MADPRILCVGAGFSGAVIARELAEAGHKCLVVDERPHVAGNCHTEHDQETGILVHKYGPHIFHTANKEVWDYVRRFGEMVPYTHRVKTTVGGRVYSMPINLHTINQFFGTSMSPLQAERLVASKARTDVDNPATFEDQALKFVGDELYRAFFWGYTRKQWGLEPSELPASILKRLPLRFDYDDNYFSHPFQGIPRDGYTETVAKILEHPNIEVRLSCSHEELSEAPRHTFYSGPVDRFFGWRSGRLGYRTLKFEKVVAPGTYQGIAVMNYGDIDIPFTRITEHKYFLPEEKQDVEKSVAFIEYSAFCNINDTPYYPIRLVNEKKMLADYVNMAIREKDVTFVGRLGTYSYIDMDVTIAQALKVAKVSIECFRTGRQLPTSSVDW